MGTGPNAGFDMDALRRFADSEAGRSMIKLLSADKEKAQAAVAKASNGNIAEAKHMIESMLSSPEFKTLLAQLGTDNGK